MKLPTTTCFFISTRLTYFLGQHLANFGSLQPIEATTCLLALFIYSSELACFLVMSYVSCDLNLYSLKRLKVWTGRVVVVDMTTTATKWSSLTALTLDGLNLMNFVFLFSFLSGKFCKGKTRFWPFKPVVLK
jgi:hypothetical protein